MLAILTGNFVQGFKAFEVPDDETTIKFFLGRVPEARLVEVHDYEALMGQYNSVSVQPAVVEVDDGDVGPAGDGIEEAPSGDTGGTGDGASEQN